MHLLKATSIKPVSLFFFFFDSSIPMSVFLFLLKCTAPFIKSIEYKNWELLNFNFEFNAFKMKIMLNQMNRIGFAINRNKETICTLYFNIYISQHIQFTTLLCKSCRLCNKCVPMEFGFIISMNN